VGAAITGNAFTFMIRLYRYNSVAGTLDSMKLGQNWTRFSFNPDLNATVTRYAGLDSTVRGFTSSRGADSESSDWRAPGGWRLTPSCTVAIFRLYRITEAA